MRLKEIQESYISNLRTDVLNLLIRLVAKGDNEINTDSMADELNKMGHSVNPNSLADLVKDMPMVKSINRDKITLKPNSNLTQFSKDATMDNEKKVDKLAKKTIDKNL
tara:strand:+ start:1136 stop:1459 length:324 start_codon:yes stop_codon:yes gene_type:complete